MEKWGAGESAKDAKAFATVMINDVVAELVHGENPHSRSDNNVYARLPNGEIEGFSGHKILWGVQIQEFNYLKESDLSGNDIREGCTALIFANQTQVFEFFDRRISSALSRAGRIILELENLPIDIWDEEERRKLVGRKVYWKDYPAVIAHLILDQGCVTIEPAEDKFPRPPYRDDDFDDEDQTMIKTEITDKNIWWWRE